MSATGSSYLSKENDRYVYVDSDRYGTSPTVYIFEEGQWKQANFISCVELLKV